MSRIGASVMRFMQRACSGPMITRRFACGATLIAASAVACTHQAPIGARTAGDDWLATWEGPPQLTEDRNMPPAPGLSNKALRQVIHITVGGSHWRYKFSNEFGNAPLAIASVSVAASVGHDTLDVSSVAAVRFSGSASTVIPAGSTAMSDEVALNVRPLSNIAITTVFGAVPSGLTGHPGSRTTSYVADASRRDAAHLTGAQAIEHWYALSNAEVRAPSAAAVVILGNSIADGRGSGTDRNNRWPDNFARRLAAESPNVAVLNAGIGGNAVLRAGLGPTAMERLERDVLAQRGVKWVIVSEGVNDVGAARADSSAIVARGLISAYGEIIRQAHTRGMRVLGATMLPFARSQYGSAAHEAARRAINDWVRTSGAFDGVIDFDAAMRDSADATRLRADGDSGDHLHPNERGYEIMANAIPLSFFVPR